MATATATMWAIVTARATGWRVTQRERARAARAHATAMRVVGIEEGEGSMAMVMATRVVGRRTAITTTRTM